MVSVMSSSIIPDEPSTASMEAHGVVEEQSAESFPSAVMKYDPADKEEA